MNDTPISIEADNIFKLTALHRILHKSKFYDEQNDLYTPYGAAWSNQILDTIIAYYKTHDKTRIKSWQEWRQLDKNRMEYAVILKRLNKAKAYYTDPSTVLTDEQKLDFIRICTSPFVLDDEILQELMTKI